MKLALLLLITTVNQASQLRRIDSDCANQAGVTCTVDADKNACHRLPFVSHVATSPVANLTVTLNVDEIANTAARYKHITNYANSTFVLRSRIEFIAAPGSHLFTVTVLQISQPGDNVPKCFVIHLITDTVAPTRLKLDMVGQLQFASEYFVEVQQYPDGAFVNRSVHTPDDPAIERLTRETACQACFLLDDLARAFERARDTICHPQLHRRNCYGSTNAIRRLEHQNMQKFDGIVNCSNPTEAHPLAIMWTGTFRNIIENPKTRIIELEFIAAPDEYCFQAYDIQMEPMPGRSGKSWHETVRFDNLKAETYGNLTIRYGRVIFDNVPEGVYQISYKPHDRHRDGKCVCPVTFYSPPNLYSMGTTCYCQLTTWPNVVMSKAPGPTMPTTAIQTAAQEQSIDKYSVWLIVAGIMLILIILACLLIIVLLYRRGYLKSAKLHEIRQIMSTPMPADIDLVNLNGVYTKSPFTSDIAPAVKLHVIYSHDNEKHEKCVESMQRLVQQSIPHAIITIDRDCVDQLTTNKVDAANRLIQEADKVILVHSVGARARYDFTQANGSNAVLRRKERTLLDDIFMMQLNFTADAVHIQYRVNKVIHVLFSYTDEKYLLSHVGSTSVRYELPANSSAFLAQCAECAVDVDAVALTNLEQCVTQASDYMRRHATWLEDSHIGVCTKLSAQLPLPAALSTESAVPVPSSSTAVDEEAPLLVNSEQTTSNGGIRLIDARQFDEKSVNNDSGVVIDSRRSGVVA